MNVLLIRMRKYLLLAFIVRYLSILNAADKFENSNLVEISKLEPSIQIDVRYATCNNFMKKPVYNSKKIYLLKPVAFALIKVNQSLKKLGYSLIVYDGYRPFSVSKIFYNFAKNNKLEKYVAPLSSGSVHNRGCAVDVSLYDIKNKTEVEMPSSFDDMSYKSSIYYYGGTIQSRKLRYLLQCEMEAFGFKVYSREWWHFDYIGWKKHPFLDVKF